MHTANALAVQRKVVVRTKSGSWTENESGLAKSGYRFVVIRQVHGQTYRFTRTRADGGTAAGTAADGAILSPMPGRIIAVEVAAGEAVTKGQKLVTLEAMKMEHSLAAPFDGIVAELNAEIGGQVSEGAVLARIERAE